MTGWNYGPYWLLATFIILALYIARMIRQHDDNRPYDWEVDGL